MLVDRSYRTDSPIIINSSFLMSSRLCLVVFVCFFLPQAAGKAQTFLCLAPFFA